MSEYAGFFPKNFSQTVSAVKRMASPEGTTIKELIENLSLNRRSVFRLLKSIEADLHIPIMVKRKDFGGTARYCLPESFIKGLSGISLPKMDLYFDEAVALYLLLESESMQRENRYIHFHRLYKVFEPVKNNWEKQSEK